MRRAFEVSRLNRQIMKRKDEYLAKVGANIRNIRRLRGYSYTELAKAMPMKPDALREIEKGYVSPLLTTLKRIADVLEVDIRDFL